MAPLKWSSTLPSAFLLLRVGLVIKSLCMSICMHVSLCLSSQEQKITDIYMRYLTISCVRDSSQGRVLSCGLSSRDSSITVSWTMLLRAAGHDLNPPCSQSYAYVVAHQAGGNSSHLHLAFAPAHPTHSPSIPATAPFGSSSLKLNS